ncbi:MAG: gliding motility-associated ABC transporter ATP-binding subunit GldA [Sphingobacteriales bacterium]|nr:gliding motility-associated ABC transporter ATP-binding subunit GldA [Sphingobacteriales bacterium]
MSVIVERLSKIYGEQKAVDEISFKAEPGKILGFLGPNGAGKSTTMKIITCFIPASSGKVTVCGFDTNSDSLEVRKRIGYLPEHNPLYLDMYVKEYLAFVAGLHDLKNPKERIQEMIALTGLEREQHKKIGQLSKGYRQRVGLAQAMIHNPDVLILDEPTSGLDPNQLSEIRKLIKQIGQQKTVILSTHIMQEVEAICDQVVIINKGKIVANDDTKNLQNHVAGEYVFRVEFDKFIDQNKMESIAGVKKANKVSDTIWLLSTSNEEAVRTAIFEFAVKNSLVMLSIQKEEEKLEDVFRRLTKKI